MQDLFSPQNGRVFQLFSLFSHSFSLIAGKFAGKTRQLLFICRCSRWSSDAAFVIFYDQQEIEKECLEKSWKVNILSSHVDWLNGFLSVNIAERDVREHEKEVQNISNKIINCEHGPGVL